MELIADILLIGGTLAAAAYCVILSRRLKRFTDLEKGVGGAIAVLSSQVDDMTKTLKVAQTSAAGSANSLDKLTSKAEGVARRLELMVASLHDLPEKEGDVENNPDERSPNVDPTTSNPPDPAAAANTANESGPLFQTQRGQYREAAE